MHPKRHSRYETCDLLTNIFPTKEEREAAAKRCAEKRALRLQPTVADLAARLDNILLHVVTEYDRRELRNAIKQGRVSEFNPYALSLYIHGLNIAKLERERGTSLCVSLIHNFCGRLLDTLLVAVGEPKEWER